MGGPIQQPVVQVVQDGSGWYQIVAACIAGGFTIAAIVLRRVLRRRKGKGIG